MGKIADFGIQSLSKIKDRKKHKNPLYEKKEFSQQQKKQQPFSVE